MQNNSQISQQGILKAADLWKTTAAEQREETFKNLCESQHINYTDAKVKVIEALKNKDPRVMFIVRQLQSMGLR